MKKVCKCSSAVIVACVWTVLFSGCGGGGKPAYEPSLNADISVTIEECADAVADALGKCGVGYHVISYRNVDVGSSELVCTASCDHPTTYYPVRVPYSSIGTTVMTRRNKVFWVDTDKITYNYQYYDVLFGYQTTFRSLDFYWTSMEPAKRFADAIFLLKQVESGGEPFTYVARGRMLKELGRLDEAKECAHKAVEYYPRLTPAFTEEDVMDVLDLDKRRQMAEDAAASARKAEADGDVGIAFGMYCKAYACSPDEEVVDEALANITRMYPKLTVVPELPESARRNFVQAEWHIKNEDHELSVEAFKQVTLCCPWHAQSHYNRGLILGQLKRYTEAIEEMKQYLALAPGAENARAVQDRIYLWEAELDKK